MVSYIDTLGLDNGTTHALKRNAKKITYNGSRDGNAITRSELINLVSKPNWWKDINGIGVERARRLEEALAR